MADTTLDIGIKGGQNAKAVIDAVTVALRLLGQQNEANRRAAEQAAAAGKAQADSLKGLAAAAQASLQGQQRLLASLQQNAEAARAAADRAKASAVSEGAALVSTAEKALSAERALLEGVRQRTAAQHAASAKTRAEALEEAKTYAKSAETAAAGFQKVAAARLKAAEAIKRTVTTGRQTVTVGPDPEVVKARRDELATANENLARARALGELRIKQAKAVGAAEDAAATRSLNAQARVVKGAEKELAQAQRTSRGKIKEVTNETNAVVKGADRQVSAQNKIVTSSAALERLARARASAAERAAAREAAAAARVERSLANQAKIAQQVERGMNSLRNTVLRLVAAYSGFRALEGFIATGLRFNQTIETSKLGIAALITAEADLTDQQGNLLGGTKALASAQVLAEDQLNKLRVAGIQTAATTEELVTAFQEAVGAGLAVGLTLDQIREFTVQVAQAATTINLPFSQLNQEVRSILQGTIDRNSRIAKSLQLTNADIALAKQQNRLADLLNEKFKAFNIAGAESVKTFAALRSNIQDAFSVLAGQATQPLFDSLKQAGLEALQQIFDFRSASIQNSFRGLVDGAKIIFREIGDALADAIGAGVENVRSLSDFFAKNKQAVKETAAAVGTMVRAFEQMVAAIASAVTGVVTLGNEINPIIGLAQSLTVVFETLRDTISTIIKLLLARTLIAGIGALAGAIAGLSAAFTVATLTTGIGALISIILVATAAFKLFHRSQQDVKLEAARITSAAQDEARATSDLVQQYINLQRQLQDQNISEQDRAILKQRLTDLTKQFNETVGPQYLKIINDTTLGIDKQREALLGLMRAQADQATAAEADARTRLFQQQQQLAALQKQGTLIKGANRFGEEQTIVDPSAVRRIKELQDNIALTKEEVRKLTRQTDSLTESLTRAAETPPIIKKRDTKPDPNQGIAPEIKQAQAELDAEKQRLDVERAKVNRDFATHVIDATERLQQLLKLDIAEIDAEDKFLQARARDAQRKIDQAPKGTKGDARRKAAEDELKAAVLLREALGLKEQQLVIEESNAEVKILQEQKDKEAQIHIEALRSRGRTLEAALEEIKLKERQALREIDDEEGQRIASLQRQISEAVKAGLPTVEVEQLKQRLEQLLQLRAEVTLNVRHESIENSVKAIKEEIDRVLTTRTREVESIRDRFRLSGQLSAQEKQQQANLISNANERAIASTAALRDQLLALREAAKLDPTLVGDIDLLIQQLDGLKVKAEEVDQEMERLKDGIRESLEGGLSTFLEDLGDKTKTFADLFTDMVNSIIKDIRRLVSQIIAQRIIQSLFSLFAGFNPAAPGIAGADNLGNIIIPNIGRAKGGPAYGKLRGGTPGIDSIPVLAQQDEWFLRPQVRRKYGDAFLKDLNELRLPVTIMNRQQVIYQQTKHFAQGGPVNLPSNGTARVDRQQVDVSGRIEIGRNGLIDFVQGPIMRSAVVKHVQSSPRSVNHVLQPQNRR